MIEDSSISEPEAKVLKRGTPKIEKEVVKPVAVKISGVLEVSDDEVEMMDEPVLGRRQIAERPISDEATFESKRAKFD